MSEEFKLQNIEEAEQRIDQIVLDTGIKPLEEDCVSMKLVTMKLVTMKQVFDWPGNQDKADLIKTFNEIGVEYCITGNNGWVLRIIDRDENRTFNIDFCFNGNDFIDVTASLSKINISEKL